MGCRPREGLESAHRRAIDAARAGELRFRGVLERSRDGHGFVGVDEAAYPYDVETHVRYHRDLSDEIEARHSHLPPLPIDRFDEITEELADEYAIEWEGI